MLRLGPLTVDGIASRIVEGDTLALLDQLIAARAGAIPVRVAGIANWAGSRTLAYAMPSVSSPRPASPSPFSNQWQTRWETSLAGSPGRMARSARPPLPAPLGLAPAVARSPRSPRIPGPGRAGAFRPGGDGVEWVDVEVLRRLKRRSLAVLRKEIDPVWARCTGKIPPRLARSGHTPTDRPGLSEVIRQLQGAAIPASALETDVLPARLNYRPEDLDRLMVGGDLVWVGTGSIGTPRWSGGSLLRRSTSAARPCRRRAVGGAGPRCDPRAPFSTGSLLLP